MRFKKGSKVEVLSKRDVPSGSWRGAEIICVNGHSYIVRYDGCEGALERISRKEIRPCPPPNFATNWVAGDVVEVFDNFSWKMATISKVLRNKYVVVRLLGSSLEFDVCELDVRPRQSWNGDKWVVIGKDSVSSNDCTHNEDLTLKKSTILKHVQRTDRKVRAIAENCCLPVMCKEKFQESSMAYSRNLKRGRHVQPEVEEYNGAPQKRRAIKKGGILHRVEAATFARDITGGKFMYSSFNNGTGFLEVGRESRKQPAGIGCPFAVDVECRDTETDSCSVGSCSITSNNSYMFHRAVGFINDVDGDYSDAESIFPSEYEGIDNLLPKKEELAPEIHRLELHAYRCTMEALHACGPLSWEQEAMVTNLRLSLHISNDEHLMEVRNLVSANNRISSR